MKFYLITYVLIILLCNYQIILSSNQVNDMSGVEPND